MLTNTDVHCRAVLLLEEEYNELQRRPLYGISLEKIQHKPLYYFVNISGLKGSLWEKGIFHATLKFSEHFDEDSPNIVFNTIPFHPNVHPESGKLHVNFQDISCPDNAKQVLTFTNILLTIQTLLSYPILKDVVNSEAATMMQNDPNEYEKMIKQCASESLRLQEVLDSRVLAHLPSIMNEVPEVIHYVKPKADEKSSSAMNLVLSKAKQVSFDVYHRAWVEVGTTKPISRYVETEQSNDLDLQIWNPDFPRSYTPASSIRLNRVKSPVYRKDPNSSTNSLRQKKLERISAMKRLYMNRTMEESEDQKLSAPTTSMTDITSVSVAKPANPIKEPWELEADDLVAWSGNLNEEAV